MLRIIRKAKTGEPIDIDPLGNCQTSLKPAAATASLDEP